MLGVPLPRVAYCAVPTSSAQIRLFGTYTAARNLDPLIQLNVEAIDWSLSEGAPLTGQGLVSIGHPIRTAVGTQSGGWSNPLIDMHEQ